MLNLLFIFLSVNAQTVVEPQFGTTIKTKVETSSYFCKCDESGENYILTRVDISKGQKLETKIRSFSKKTFTLPECESLITKHPSCSSN